MVNFYHSMRHSLCLKFFKKLSSTVLKCDSQLVERSNFKCGLSAARCNPPNLVYEARCHQKTRQNDALPFVGASCNFTESFACKWTLSFRSKEGCLAKRCTSRKARTVGCTRCSFRCIAPFRISDERSRLRGVRSRRAINTHYSTEMTCLSFYTIWVTVRENGFNHIAMHK